MAYCAAWRVPNDYQTTLEYTEADDPCLSVVLPLVFDLSGQPVEDSCGIVEVKSSVGQCPFAFGWIVGDAHGIIVYTKKSLGKRDSRTVFCEA
jgi:hypothetical protein